MFTYSVVTYVCGKSNIANSLVGLNVQQMGAFNGSQRTHMDLSKFRPNILFDRNVYETHKQMEIQMCAVCSVSMVWMNKF